MLVQVTSLWSCHALPDLFYHYGLKSLSSIMPCSYLVFHLVCPLLPILFVLTYFLPLPSSVWLSSAPWLLSPLSYCLSGTNSPCLLVSGLLSNQFLFVNLTALFSFTCCDFCILVLTANLEECGSLHSSKSLSLQQFQVWYWLMETLIQQPFIVLLCQKEEVSFNSCAWKKGKKSIFVSKRLTYFTA